MKKLFAALALSNAAIAATPVFAQDLETIAEFDKRPGNPTVSADGRVFVTMSALDNPEVNVLEVMPDGTTKVFPNEVWASKPKQGTVVGINSTIGLQAVGDHLWVMDMGAPDKGQPPKLVAWNLSDGSLHKALPIPAPALVGNSFLQDFAIDQKRGIAIIADMTQPFASDTGPADTRPAFVVVDLDTGLARRVLENHPSLQPAGDTIVLNGKPVTHKPKNGEAFSPQYPLNPIAISPDSDWLYFGSMGNTKVYRLPAAMLSSPTIPEQLVAESVQFYRDKPETDGIDVDSDGRVYVTDVENFAVGVVDENGYRVLAKDEDRLEWPDGVAVSRDGYLYIVANELNNLPALNAGTDASTPPFYLHRIKIEGSR